jgi:hypothetical protein
MSGTDLTARASARRELANRQGGRRANSAPVWMAAAFFISLALAAIVLAKFGAGEHGITQALRATARWCFVLFCLAYAGGALAKSCGPRFAVLARHGREFGLAFAAALSVHVALVLWLIRIAADPQGAMLFFWAGVFCTYALALFSLPRLRDLLGERLWRIGCELALQYIALVFADDFIFEPLQGGGPDKYPLSYLPFVILLIGGVGLRLAGFIWRPRAAGQSQQTLTGNASH